MSWNQNPFFFSESQHKVKTKWIVADFSKDKSIYDHIARELEGIPVGILGKIVQ